jgi:uncharacterized membrane protein
MSIVAEVLKELWSMFMADARMTAAILVLVALVAAFLRWKPMVDPLAGGLLLLIGSIAIVAAITVLHARRLRKDKPS